MTATAERLTTYTVSDARQILHGVTRRTPLVSEGFVGNGNLLLSKRESEQLGGTYKTRGLYVGAVALKARGYQRFVLASAGNAAAGGAVGANRLGMHGTIYMPEGTPLSKRENTERLGGSNVTIKIEGNSYKEAHEAALAEVSDEVAELHAYDDMNVAIGNGGTMTAEVLEERPDINRIFIAAGGAGGAGGAARAILESGSQARLTVVQYEGNDSFVRSLELGEVVDATNPESLESRWCEGVNVQRIGNVGLRLCEELVDRIDVVTVTASDVGREVVLEDRRRQELRPVLGELAFDYFPETTGLVARAGARVYTQHHPEERGGVWAAMITGSNTDPERESNVVAAYHSELRAA